LDGATVVYRFLEIEAVPGQNAYAGIKQQLEDLANAVRQGVSS